LRSEPFVIGVAGASCSGKSSLANYLKERFRDRRPSVISCDSYYRDLSNLSASERATRNFDNPDAIQSDLLIFHMETLVSGKEVLQPVYDVSTHTRSAQSIRITPGELIIVEGIFVLYWSELRKLLNTKVFVALSEEKLLFRRMTRDVMERGRTQESVLNQYNQSVKPMMNKYVLPTKVFADILVNGADPVEQSAARVMNFIRFSHKK
jgi:uridine kinase